MTDPTGDAGRSVLRRCEERLTALRSERRLRLPRTVDLLPGGRCRIDGRDVVNFGGNDYLGLAQELGSLPRLRDVLKIQVGSTASAIVAGRSRHHAELERVLAEFEQTESALLFPSGYAANLGVLNTLVEPGDAVICDRDNHASLIDAARNCDGRLLVYRRGQLDKLKHSLRRRRASFGNVFLVTDGVFSMDGEVAPLAELCDLAEEFDAVVIIDEAHGTGVLGQHGRGACDYCDVDDRVFLRIGTMSKAMGGLGGFAVSHAAVVELLRNTARTQFFSTALPPVLCEAMLESVRVIREEPERREKLTAITKYARGRAAELGEVVIGDGVAPIIPIGRKEEEAAVQTSARLLNEGFFVPAIRPPTVPTGTSRLRMSLTYLHSQDLVDQAMQTLVNC